MDVEVSKALRVLQRAGVAISPLSPQMDIQELTTSYGDLLHKWVENQGYHCAMVPLAHTRYNSSGRVAETFLQGRATEYLNKLFETENRRLPVNLQVRQLANWSYLHSSRLPDHTLIGDSAIGHWLSRFSPESLNDSLLGLRPHPKEKVAIIFFFNKEDGEDFAARVYSYREEFPEEIAKKDERRTKAAQAAEKRRKTMEAKEKALLEKLKAKYEESSNG